MMSVVSKGLTKRRKSVVSFVLTVLALVASFSVSAQQTLHLQSTVKGNKEQPKVLYILPWQAPEAVSGLEQELSLQLGEVFAHLEPDELRREIQYRQLFAQQKSHSVKTDQ
jgi:hypothetical protein